MLKITLNKLPWEVPGKFEMTAFWRLDSICVGGRTSLKDANANCTWLNENRTAEEMGGKIFTYYRKSLFCKAVDFAEKQNHKIKIRREKKEIKDV